MDSGEWDVALLGSDSSDEPADAAAFGSANSTMPKPSHNNSCDHSDDENEESAHFDRIIDAFLYYRRHSEAKLRSKVQGIRSISTDHLSMVPRYKDHLRRVHECILDNFHFLKTVVLATGKMFENRRGHRRQPGDDQNNNDDENYSPIASEFNMEKLHSTLRQVVRDWTVEGEMERRQCYDPILAELTGLWPDEDIRRDVKVLVPGAGLGRLAYEIARSGFECQGNEFSLFMLFVSNYILNHCKSLHQWTIYPYVNQWMNNWTYEDQTRPVTFPDVNPSDLPPTCKFSMAAGDFLDVYGRRDNEHCEEKWDAVVTVFFLDTAHNIISYLETIHHILKPHGYWLNLGPLLYHFADMENEVSLELPYEEILTVAKKLGFDIITEKKVSTTYTQNTRSMLQYLYHCPFVVFRKSS